MVAFLFFPLCYPLQCTAACVFIRGSPSNQVKPRPALMLYMHTARMLTALHSCTHAYCTVHTALMLIALHSNYMHTANCNPIFCFRLYLFMQCMFSSRRLNCNYCVLYDHCVLCCTVCTLSMCPISKRCFRLCFLHIVTR